MIGVAVGPQGMLLAPQPPGTKAKPDPARLNIRIQLLQLCVQVPQSPLLLMQPALQGCWASLGNLFLGLGNAPLQVIPTQ